MKTAEDYDKNLIKAADDLFNDRIVDASSKEDIQKAIESGKIARCSFCSVSKDGEKCAEVVEKEINAEVRGTRFEREVPKGKTAKCAVCGKKAKEVVYIARAY